MTFPNTMLLKQNDNVKLLPAWPHSNSRFAPVWGGPLGYIPGRVIKVTTHHHDESLHGVEVEWGYPDANPDPSKPLPVGTFHEKYLALMSEDDEAIAQEAEFGSPVTSDVWVLIRTHTGRFALNVIEAGPYGWKDPRYIAGVTRHVLPTTSQSDYFLANYMLSAVDHTDTKANTLFDAVSTIFRAWELPALDSVQLPLPTYESVSHAALTCPIGDHAGILLFHTPRSLIDFANDQSSESTD